jgi:N-acetylmuramoyl-L-alanine amidase
MKNFFLSSFLLCSFSAYAQKSTPSVKRDTVFKIMLDAGHGAHDHGCRHYGRSEKNINLSVTQKLGALLEKTYPFVRVSYTRTDDTFIGLDDRAILANEARVDLFISIHCNASSKSAHGTETFFYQPLPNTLSDEDVWQQARENWDGGDSSQLRQLYVYHHAQMIDNQQNLVLKGESQSVENSTVAAKLPKQGVKSKKLANFVEEEMVLTTKRRSRGVKEADFKVLSLTNMPSVLIEIGFLSNPTEGKYLGSEEGQDNISAAISQAFGRYLKEIGWKMPKQMPPQVILAKNELPAKANKMPIPPPQEVAPLEYRVQIFASAKPTEFNDLPVDVEEIKDGQLYRYYSLPTDKREDAISLRNQLRVSGFKDAFVVVYERRNSKK